MKVLMFGWEFPPFNKGGLGTACYGLTRGLKNKGANVTFVVPKAPGNVKGEHVDLLVADSFYLDPDSYMKFIEIDSLLLPYITFDQYKTRLHELKGCIKKNENYEGSDDLYGNDLYAEVYRFADKARLVSALEDHDIIHAHDWMTFPAAVEAQKVSGKPMVIHVHATEFDRTGGNGCNQYVYDIERMGMHAADRVMAVSNLTRERIITSYGVDPSKVEVVHNAVDFTNTKFTKTLEKDSDEAMILFLGRITMQKGPEYFLRAAKLVTEMIPDKKVKFVFAGTGDMEGQMISLAGDLGISDKVRFAGWVTGPDIDKLYSMADLYVMPSVSEPFGLTPLEAMRNNTPVLISKTSGVSEVIKHAMKVDFWDVEEMAEKMVAVINYSSLHSTLAENGYTEVHKFSWDEPAAKCINVYNSVLSRGSGTGLNGGFNTQNTLVSSKWN